MTISTYGTSSQQSPLQTDFSLETSVEASSNTNEGVANNQNVKVNNNSNGNGAGNDSQHQIQDLQVGEPALEAPHVDSKPEKGLTIFHMILETIQAIIQGTNERRIVRMEDMNDLMRVKEKLVEQESQKLTEQQETIQSKKKKGFWGKLFAIVAIVIAVVVVVAAIMTGGALLGPAIGAVVAIASGVDALFNEGKIMNKIMENTVGKVVTLIAKGLEKMGVSESVASIIAVVIVTIVMIAAAMAASSVFGSKGAQLATKAAQGSDKFATSAASSAKLAQHAAKLGDMPKATQAAKSAHHSSKQANQFAHKAFQQVDNAQARFDKLDNLVKLGKMDKLNPKYINAKQDLVDIMAHSRDAYKSARSAKAAAAVADDAIQAGNGTKSVRTGLNAVQESKKLGKLDEAQNAAESTRKNADLLSEAAEISSKRAVELRKNADNIILKSKSSKVDPDIINSAKEAANNAEFVAQKSKQLARSGQKMTKEADDIVAQMQPAGSANNNSKVASASTGTTKVDKMQVTTQSQSINDDIKIMVDNLDDVAGTRWNAVVRVFVPANAAVTAGNEIYSATIDIINAKLDYLIAQDQADIKKIKSLSTLIDKIFEAMSSAVESDATLVQDLKSQLDNIMHNVLPASHLSYYTATA